MDPNPYPVFLAGQICNPKFYFEVITRGKHFSEGKRKSKRDDERDKEGEKRRKRFDNIMLHCICITLYMS